MGNTLHKIGYDFGQDLTKLWETCVMKSDGIFAQNRIQLWTISHTTLGKTGQDLIQLWACMMSHAQIRLKLPEIAQHEKDHLCR